MSNEDEEEDDAAPIGVGRKPCMTSLVALQQTRNRLHLTYLGKELMGTAPATSKELRKISDDITEFQANLSSVTAGILLERPTCVYPNLEKMVQRPEQTSGMQHSKHLCTEECAKETTDAPDANIWRETIKSMILMLQLKKSANAETTNKSASKPSYRPVQSLMDLKTEKAAALTETELKYQIVNRKMNERAKIDIPRTKESIAYILAELKEKKEDKVFRIKKMITVKGRLKKKKLKKDVKWVMSDELVTYDGVQRRKYKTCPIFSRLLENTRDVDANNLQFASFRDFFKVDEALKQKIKSLALKKKHINNISEEKKKIKDLPYTKLLQMSMKSNPYFSTSNLGLIEIESRFYISEIRA